MATGDSKDKVVRLRLLGSTTSTGEPTLREQMLQRVAAWDQTKQEQPPVWLEEIGLQAREVDLLRSEGAEIHVLRGIGRRLQSEGRERTLATYRRLLIDVVSDR